MRQSPPRQATLNSRLTGGLRFLYIRHRGCLSLSRPCICGCLGLLPRVCLPSREMFDDLLTRRRRHRHAIDQLCQLGRIKGNRHQNRLAVAVEPWSMWRSALRPRVFCITFLPLLFLFWIDQMHVNSRLALVQLQYFRVVRNTNRLTTGANGNSRNG
jgi:hypothetical protein